MEFDKKRPAHEKYWEGISNHEDEESLFKNPPEGDEDYFELVQKFRELNLSESFEDRLLTRLNHHPQVTKMPRRKIFRYAAAAAVVLGVGLTVVSEQNKVNSQGLTVQEQRELEMTKQVLYLMSAKLNEGMSYTYSLGEFDKAINKVSEN